MKRITALMMCFFILYGSAAAESAALDERESVVLPVIMYHSLLKHRSDAFIISPDMLEDDLQWLSQNGYEAVTVSDILAYVNDGAALPEKPVMLTFDDGHYNNCYYGAPLLEKYGMKAVLFVVGTFCDGSSERQEENPNYSYLTWERLGELSERGIFEVQNHTWGLHSLDGARRGIRKKQGESGEQYNKTLRDDLEKLQSRVEEATGTRPMAFAYPFGIVERNAQGVFDELGLSAVFTCEYGVNVLVRGESESLRRLKRTRRSPGNPVSRILSECRQTM